MSAAITLLAQFLRSISFFCYFVYIKFIDSLRFDGMMVDFWVLNLQKVKKQMKFNVFKQIHTKWNGMEWNDLDNKLRLKLASQSVNAVSIIFLLLLLLHLNNGKTTNKKSSQFVQLMMMMMTTTMTKKKNGTEVSYVENQ